MAHRPNPQRFVKGRCFTSRLNPSIQIEFDPAFIYVGNVEFDLKGVARADRHVFVVANKQQVERMIVLQFEGFLDNNQMTYSYLPRNPVDLGGKIYGHDNSFFSIAAEVAEHPGAEIDHTARLLESHGYHLEDEQMTARFERIIDAARRNEFLIFYHENIKVTGHALAVIAKDDIILKQYQSIALALTRRSLASFKILSQVQAG